MRGKGESSVYKRPDGLWAAAVELPPVDGKRRRKVITSKSKATVLKKLGTIKSELERAGDLPTASQTLESWLNYWLTKVAPKRIAPTTLYTYRSQINKQVIPVLGKTRLDKLTPSSIRRLHDHMTDAGLSSTYALTTHRVLAKALTDAVREGRVSRNVAELVDPPRQAKVELEPLDVDEAIQVLLKAAEALTADVYDPSAVLWASYLLTATRRGELLGLEWDRVVFDGDNPHVDLSWQLQRIKDISTAPADYEYRPVKGKLYLVRPKSRSGWRIIPLVDPLASLLRDHQARSAPNTHGLVFAPSGAPVQPSRASTGWKEWKPAVTKKATRLHDLRHTTVDLLYAAGVPEDIIQEIVGHSTRGMTRAYKARGNQERLTAAMRQLSTLLTPKSEA